MRTILGLDLGTNSIGWAKVCINDDGNYVREIKLGSRIIPMSQDTLSNFDKRSNRLSNSCANRIPRYKKD